VLPKVTKKPSVFCARFILFVPQRLVAPELNIFGEGRDILLLGGIVEEGEALCSLIVEGPNKDCLLQKALKTAEAIRNSCVIT
jgi:predicted ATP-grasp superfamily ATP-dependent carboligase